MRHQQDMTQATPTQDLVAKDLHGYEWRFKHIFRGNIYWGTISTNQCWCFEFLKLRNFPGIINI